MAHPWHTHHEGAGHDNPFPQCPKVMLLPGGSGVGGCARGRCVAPCAIWHQMLQPVAHTPRAWMAAMAAHLAGHGCWGLSGGTAGHTSGIAGEEEPTGVAAGQLQCIHGQCWGCTCLGGGCRSGKPRAQGKDGAAVPVSGRAQASPQPEKQHLRFPGQSRSSAQRLEQVAALLRARFRGQTPGLA